MCVCVRSRLCGHVCVCVRALALVCYACISLCVGGVGGQGRTRTGKPRSGEKWMWTNLEALPPPKYFFHFCGCDVPKERQPSTAHQEITATVHWETTARDFIPFVSKEYPWGYGLSGVGGWVGTEGAARKNVPFFAFGVCVDARGSADARSSTDACLS